jgi:hypothetical protein
MPKDKYNFIQELLENRKLSLDQRERVLLLTKEEIRKEGLLGQGLAERLAKLEQLVSAKVMETPVVTNDTIIEDNSKEYIQDLPKYIDPSHLYKYIFDYNQNPILKSTCHEIDSNELENILSYCETTEYHFEKHLEKILEAFRVHDKKFAPSRVKALIRGYLTGKNFKGEEISGWSSHTFSINWSCTGLMNWSHEMPGVPPNIDEGLMEQIENTGFEFNAPFVLRNGNLIRSMSDLVLYFKRLFHIRSDNSLNNIIKNTNKAKGWDQKIDFRIDDSKFPNNVEIFTDVDSLLQAYGRIIELILEQAAIQEIKPVVRLSLTEKDNSVEFSILHQQSVYGKTIKNTTERLGNKYKGLIANQINGLCNFYVQADFECKESYRIGIWNQPDLWIKKTPQAIRLTESIGGVEHLFQILKPKMEHDIFNRR